MKKAFLSIFVLIAMLSLSISASAEPVKSVDTFMKYYTKDTYSGISGELVIPSNVSVEGSSVLNFQLGLSNIVEGGISYQYGRFKAHINSGRQACIAKGNKESYCDQFNRTEFLNIQPKPGEVVTVKIVNNGNNTVDFYVNGSRVINGNDWGTRPVFVNLPATTQVKQMHISTVTDGRIATYSNASWKNVKLRANSAGTVYKNWDSSTPIEKPAHQNESNLTIHSKLDPLTTSRR